MSEEAKSNGVSWPVVLGVVILVIMIAAGTTFLMVYLFSRTDVAETNNRTKVETKKEAEKKEEMGPKFEMGQFLVNISGSRSYRFIKAKMVLEADDKKTLEELETRAPQLRDAINEILRSQSPEDIQDPSLTNVKKEIKDKLNDLLAKGKVDEVFITEFIVQ